MYSIAQQLTAHDVLGSVPRWTLATPTQAASLPYAAIASLRLLIIGSSGRFWFFLGSGWFMNPTSVVTAAHVTDISEAWSSVPAPVSWHVEVIPGLTGDQKPFGTFWAASVNRHPSWTGRHTTGYDIGVIKIAAQNGAVFPEEKCLHPTSDLITEDLFPTVEIAGYPYVVDKGSTPVRSAGPVRAVEGPLCFYDIDTEDGQSGAPVMSNANEISVVGIHSGGQGNGGTSLSNGLNAGLRLTRELLSWLQAQ
jgi:glutamyl endopeptidase